MKHEKRKGSIAFLVILTFVILVACNKGDTKSHKAITALTALLTRPSPTLPGNPTMTVARCKTNYSIDDCLCPSPIVVDVLGNGFAFSDPAGGVNFDIDRNNRPEKIAWTLPGSDDAFLALDRNGNGQIDDGGELFGNYTDQPEVADKNGFLALALFDENGDGHIDARDSVYGRLRLWQDVNHDGVSQPEELHTIESFGVQAINLSFEVDPRVDENGNYFKYRGSLVPALGAAVNPVVYDVFLATENTPIDPVTGIRGLKRYSAGGSEVVVMATNDACGSPPPSPPLQHKTQYQCLAECYQTPKLYEKKQYWHNCNGGSESFPFGWDSSSLMGDDLFYPITRPIGVYVVTGRSLWFDTQTEAVRDSGAKCLDYIYRNGCQSTDAQGYFYTPSSTYAGDPPAGVLTLVGCTTREYYY